MCQDGCVQVVRSRVGYEPHVASGVPERDFGLFKALHGDNLIFFTRHEDDFTGFAQRFPLLIGEIVGVVAAPEDESLGPELSVSQPSCGCWAALAEPEHGCG